MNLGEDILIEPKYKAGKEVIGPFWWWLPRRTTEAV
jgi:hypothetical protein